MFRGQNEKQITHQPKQQIIGGQHGQSLVYWKDGQYESISFLLGSSAGCELYGRELYGRAYLLR